MQSEESALELEILFSIFVGQQMSELGFFPNA